RVRVLRHEHDQRRDEQRIRDEDAEEQRRTAQDPEVLAEEQADVPHSQTSSGPTSTPSFSATTRSACRSTSSRFCVEKTTAPPSSRTPTTSQSRRRWLGSSEAVGSSRSRTCGAPMSASATFSRWRFPTESVDAGTS